MPRRPSGSQEEPGPSRPRQPGNNRRSPAKQLQSEPAFGNENGAQAQKEEPAPRTIDTQTGDVLPRAGGELFEPEAEFPSEEKHELTPEEKLKETLKGYKARIPASLKQKNGQLIHELIDALVTDPRATQEALNSFIDRCELYLQQKKGGAA